MKKITCHPLFIFFFIFFSILFFPKIASLQLATRPYINKLFLHSGSKFKNDPNLLIFSKRQKFQRYSTDSNFKVFQVSVGLGIAKYDKISVLYTAEIFSQLDNNFSAGIGIDYYNVLRKLSSKKKIRSVSIYAIYYNSLFLKNRTLCIYNIGGGISFSQGIAPVGIFRLYFNINKNISVGGEYKQPIVIGSDFSAPPLMLFDLIFSYKIKPED